MRKCTLDKDDICVGCYRSMRENLDWLSMDVSEQQATLQRCDERRQQKKPAYSLINRLFR
jgi:predicted Fe-S protein YdhL (DUF1289 family)